jgi:ankyrin repeat protein
MNGHTAAVQELLASGATVAHEKRQLGSALHVAAIRGHAAVAQVLLAAGANAGPDGERGRPP